MFAPVGTLAQLLEPYPEDDFIRLHWNKTFKYIEGENGRFESLLPWWKLNDILAQHQLDDPRVRVVKGGKTMNDPPYIWYWRPRDAPFASGVPRLEAETMSAHLRDGATLVVNYVEGLHEPLTTLTRNLENTFKTAVNANVFAGWRTTNGFDVHWDAHDVMVLQIYGRKRWKVYGPTRLHPLQRDVDPNTEPPKSPPLWEGMMTSGDVLYIPRGVWHEATPMDEPTLHLTVGFSPSTGEHLFEWIVRRLRASEAVRNDLPRLAGLHVVRQHAAVLKEAFDALWHPEILDEYFRSLDQNVPRRVAFSLPYAAMDKPFADSAPDIVLEWRTARDCRLEADDNGTLRLTAHGREWEFEAAARPLLDMLMKGGQHRVSDLRRAFEGSLSNDQVVEFLESLLHDGLLVAR